MRTSNERGIALITTLLVMMLISALLVGFTAIVMSDQRYRFIDRDRSQAFYAASGAMEKMTADLGNLFFANLAPRASQILALTAAAPTISGVTYTTTSAPGPLPASHARAEARTSSWSKASFPTVLTSNHAASAASSPPLIAGRGGGSPWHARRRWSARAGRGPAGRRPR